ncbi:MAG TPA: Gfo/Idh/MocA family oxidoreductase [Crenalkalicoccus sp.]|nr:Gfo/Idh/MocA family oxidoreductase [Crenalkalicoccus sp.]
MTPDGRLRWGLVGLGSLAANGIMPAVARSAHAMVTACASRDLASAEAFAARFGIPRAHADAGALARDPAVDAVFVMTPNALHAAPVLAAAAAGKPVLCEKPLALAEAEAEAMLAACTRAGVMLRLGLHLRFERFFDRIGALLREGAIGGVRSLAIERAAPMAERRAWREDAARGGSILYDVGVHLVDLVPRLLGQPVVGLAAMASPPPGSGRGADTMTLLLRMADDAQATMRITREAPSAGNALQAFGTGGHLSTGPLRWAERYTLRIATPAGEREESAAPCDLYRDEMDAFALDLADGGTRLGTGEDGLRLVRVAEAAERAAREGRFVAMPR